MNKSEQQKNIEIYLSSCEINFDIEEKEHPIFGNSLCIYFEDLMNKEKLSPMIDDLTEMAEDYILFFKGVN